MKKSAFRSLVIISATIATMSVTSCSSRMEEPFDSRVSQESVSSPFSIGETRAAAISGKLLGLETRGGETPVIEPVIEPGHTRAMSEISDTVAFIINYPESNKFAVIANDSRVQPILAYSETNTFDSKDEMVKTEFLDRIPDYIGEKAAGSDWNPWISSSGLIIWENINYTDRHLPILKVCIPQTDPFNKFVVVDHPDYPVGCVPLASFYVISHSIKKATLNGKTYYFNKIINRLAEGKKILPPGTGEKYSLDDAIDDAADFLYEFGKSIHADYEGFYYITVGSDSIKVPVTTAFDDYALVKLKELGCEIPQSRWLDSYNEIRVFNYLCSNYIIYAQGGFADKEGGWHAWVIDGCVKADINPESSCDEVEPNDEYKIYVHCDWGYGGRSNGWYTGSIFEQPNKVQYEPLNYFAVKINK